MSGTMQYRLNRVWTDSVQTSYGIMKLFAEFLAFFDDHPEFSIISYGTGKTETGTSTPTTWKDWGDTDGSGACPFSDNSWFVAEAQKASADLSGSGARKWCAKFQVTRTTAFDDCNVADVDYDGEGELYSLYVRFAPDGSWVGSGTLDFTDDATHTPSRNLRIADYDWAVGALNHRIHFMGDDDTIIWVAQAAQTATSLPDYNYQKFGYLGEPVRRNSNHTRPEIAIVAEMNRTGGGHDLCKGSNEAATSVFSNPQYGGSTVPSFSIAADDSHVGRHMCWMGYDAVGATQDVLYNGNPDPWTSDAEFIGIVIRQNEDEHNSILGQLRLIESAAEYVSEGALWGTGDRLSVGKGTSTRGGLAVPWPGSSTTPIF